MCGQVFFQKQGLAMITSSAVFQRKNLSTRQTMRGINTPKRAVTRHPRQLKSDLSLIFDEFLMSIVPIIGRSSAFPLDCEFLPKFPVGV